MDPFDLVSGVSPRWTISRRKSSSAKARSPASSIAAHAETLGATVADHLRSFEPSDDARRSSQKSDRAELPRRLQVALSAPRAVTSQDQRKRSEVETTVAPRTGAAVIPTYRFASGTRANRSRAISGVAARRVSPVAVSPRPSRFFLRSPKRSRSRTKKTRRTCRSCRAIYFSRRTAIPSR